MWDAFALALANVYEKYLMLCFKCKYGITSSDPRKINKLSSPELFVLKLGNQLHQSSMYKAHMGWTKKKCNMRDNW